MAAKQPASKATAPTKTRAKEAVPTRTTASSKAAKQPKPVAPAKDTTKARQPSGLDAAHAVLRQRSKPMSVRSITDAIFEQKMWTTSGKTPHATIASAIIREIKDKGSESRFVKTGKGLFATRGTTMSAKAAKPETSAAKRQAVATTPKG